MAIIDMAMKMIVRCVGPRNGCRGNFIKRYLWKERNATMYADPEIKMADSWTHNKSILQ